MIDVALRPDLVGAPRARIDGRAKVTGAARYGGDHAPAGLVYVALATAPHVGTVTGIAGRRVPGVYYLLTHENAPDSEAKVPLQSATVAHAGAIVAAVVAETAEIAEAAARDLDISMEVATWRAPDLAAAREAPDADTPCFGDPEAAFRRAAHQIEAVYDTPAQHHSALELHAVTVSWEGDRVRVRQGSQYIPGARARLAEALEIDPERVLIEAPFTGGAFGGRGTDLPLTWLGAVVSRQLGRPARVAMTRAQCYTALSHRPTTRDRVHVACDANGRLTALDHLETSAVPRGGSFSVPTPAMTARMYGWSAARTAQRIAEGDIAAVGAMRAPETPGILALECAIDELAFVAGVDPLSMRLASDTDADPVTGKPFTSRSLAECLRRGGEAFGWLPGQPPQPHQEGPYAIGYGCASTFYPTYESPSVIELTLADSGATVRAGVHEIGVGITTVLRSEAARLLSLPEDSVAIETGRSDQPPSAIAAGSRQTASVLSALRRAVGELREEREGGRALPLTVKAVHKPPGVAADPLDDPAAATMEVSDVVADGYARAAHGALFAEVAVHRLTGMAQVRRLLGAFAAGRIVNEKLARSQLTGGMTWGISLALHEESARDGRGGQIVSDALADYHFACAADVPDLEVVFVPERDETVNPAGVKGVGQLGVLGTGAAVLNAIYQATGVRCRSLPVRPEHLA